MDAKQILYKILYHDLFSSYIKETYADTFYSVTPFPDWDSKAESDLKIRKFSSSLDSWSPFWKESEKQLRKLAIHEDPQQAIALFTSVNDQVCWEWFNITVNIIQFLAHFKTISERIGHSKRGIHESLCYMYFWLV